MMTDNQPLISARQSDGRFASSPANKGRPVGAKNKISRQYLSQVKSMGPDAIQKLWEAVLSGQEWAIRLVVGHILPRDRTVEFFGSTADDVTAALALGDLSASEAKDIATALRQCAELSQLGEMRARLEALERAVGNEQK